MTGDVGTLDVQFKIAIKVPSVIMGERWVPQESHFRNHFRTRKLPSGEDACLQWLCNVGY